MMKKIFLYLFLLLIIGLFGCQKADLSQVENLRENKIGIIGHGGLGFLSPQVNLPSNTFEGITKAVEGYGVEGVELDVQLSRDGKLILYHDSRLQTLTDCFGCIYQFDLEELETCKYLRGFNTQHFNDQRLVSLDKIIERYMDRDPKPYIFLDLKTSPDCPHTFEYSNFLDSFAISLQELFERYNCQDWLIIESADFSFLKKIQNTTPEVKLSFFTLLDDSAIQLAAENDFFGLSANFEGVNRALVQKAHAENLFVTLGILKIRRDAIEMIEMSPDFIYTDNIPLLQEILN